MPTLPLTVLCLLLCRFSPPEDGEDVGDSLVRRNPERLPADSLPMSTADIWSTIRHQKDLNLPAHKV